MATYTFTLLVDATILAKQSSDSLCIAKKINGAFTTVFQDAAIKPKRANQKPLLTSNTFSWEDKYRVFATVDYRHGLLVRSATNNQQLSFGQETSYDNNSFTPAKTAAASDFLNPSGPQSPNDSFLTKKIPNTLHIAVEMNAGNAWVPVYVDPDVHNGAMDHQLTPLNEYIVFWSNSVQTSSMIDESKCPNPKHFSYEGNTKDLSLRYGYRVPDQQGPGEQPDFFTN